MSYRSILAETVTLVGHNGDSGGGYYARPITDGKAAGIVVIHHMPGWDEWIIEVARKFAPPWLRGHRSTSLFSQRSRKPRRHRRESAGRWRGSR
jgi:hypothetical protein